MIRRGNGSTSRLRFLLPSATSMRHIPELCRRRSCRRAFPSQTPACLQAAQDSRADQRWNVRLTFLQRLVLRSGRMLQGLGLGGIGRPLATFCCGFGAQSKKANDRGTRCGNNFACYTFRLARLQNRLVLPRHGERCLGASSSCAGDVLTRCYQGPGSAQLRVPQATRRSSFRSPFREERGKRLPRKMASANPTREANRSFQKQNFFFMFLAQSVGPYVCQIGPGPREICSNRLPQ